MRIAVHGTGAIGACLGGWLLEAGHQVSFVGRTGTVQSLRSTGLTLDGREAGEPLRTLRITAAETLAELQEPDLVLLGVKNFGLEAAARELLQTWGGRPLVLSLQNGLEAQAVLPRHFDRCAFGVVCFNAWRDGPSAFGYQRRGPLVVGSLDPALRAECERLAAGFGAALACQAETRIEDAAKCKLLLNLSNSILAIVGHGVRPIEDVGALRRCVSSILYEGMQTLQQSGVREVRLPHVAGWRKIRVATHLPAFVADRIFARNLAWVRMTSMAQDVYRSGRRDTELATLNGWIVAEARRIGFRAPRNEALYALMQRWLAGPELTPMHERELWSLLEAAR